MYSNYDTEWISNSNFNFICAIWSNDNTNLSVALLLWNLKNKLLSLYEQLTYSGDM